MRCTRVYGHPEMGQKQHTWTLLRRLEGLSPSPWLCFGDFNEILHPHEKSGGNERNVNSINNFRQALRDCELADVGYKGYPFTWSNGRFGQGFIEERLHRFVCNRAWSDNFVNDAAINLNTWTSYHCPVLMMVQERGEEMAASRRQSSRIHYEDMWSPYEACKEIVSEEWSLNSNWQSGNPVYLFRKIAKESMARLLNWSKREFRGREKQLEQLQKQLQGWKQRGVQYESGKEIKMVENHIQNIIINEEIYWKQRSRADWLKEGDKNTKFFHHKASNRKKKNRIWGIENSSGDWLKRAKDVEDEFCNYFTELFTTTKPSQNQMEAVLKGITPRVSEDMNEALEKPFTAEEVTEALNQMCPTKALGPDGLPAAFYQKHWKEVKEGVLTTCLHILNNQGTLAPLNYTYIAMIPKKGKPRKVTDFRPISLYNVIYKIVAKSVANRFKQILHQIISPMQSAFIPDRLITDNVIVGYECLHKIRHCKGRKNGLVALKLDVSKAYDRLEWSFIEQTMKCMGFSQNWICLVMKCISSVSFSLIINGSVRGVIKPQRGLRQGCPLSPYLFITCAEVFSSLLLQAEQQKLIHGLSFGKELSISHLLFADDSLIFSRASMTDCGNLKKILDCYSAASGQIFNFEKSSLFLSGNVQHDRATAIGQIFHLNIVSRHEKYLGLPAMIGRKRSNFFNDIKLKVFNKISNRQHKFFSCGGKEVLIKAAAQAIPAYAMSVFKIPMGVCNDIQKTVADFWYFQNKDFMKAKLGSTPSFVWRSILWGRQILSSGARWRIGDGPKIQIHKDNWIPKPSTFKPIVRPSLPEDTLVAELINEENKWNESLIYRHFNRMDADKIVEIPLPRSPKEDTIIWHYDKKGLYSVKSGYQTALSLKFPAMPSSSMTGKNQWNIIWSLALPEKIRIFAWRAAKNILPSAENLWKRRVIQEPTCQVCKFGVENVFHALVECKAARKIWRLTLFENDIMQTAGQDFLSLLHELYSRRNKADLELMIMICWMVWNARNEMLFKGKRENPQALVAKAEAVLEAYKRVQKPEQVRKESQQVQTQQVWNPPQNGFVKVNVDAATSSEKHLAGLGAIIRDDQGTVIAAAIKISKFNGDVAFAEAEALEWGLQIARNASAKALIVESDAQSVVKLVNNKQGGKSEIFWIISEIQNLMRNFELVSINYTHRSRNAIAHSLAKLALEKCENVVWMGSYPSQLMYLFSSSN
ncbi:reverse transcriptase domain-containing protein [Citrus sinensis]|uniref:Reverse transcriptase domain-containing protein n=1 Tax=Citrus sinensis TaxID=2711 RepID=A0ACB8MBH9_CITSI|nr:reverse transcriptase domain-containing protein [Citrus sinensis]